MRKKVRKDLKGRFLHNDPDKDKISHDEKENIVRDLLRNNPQWYKYGYNRQLIKLAHERFNVDLKEDEVTRLIQLVLKKWQNEQTVKVSKAQVIEMMLNNHDRALDDIKTKQTILMDISKLSGHQIERVANFEIPFGEGTMDPEEEKRLAKELGIIFTGERKGKK